MADKLVSVILPCYNVESYLERCFESLIRQTIGIEQLELIFVNDASTDGTLDILLDYEKRYPESVLVINFTENRKQGAARNAAMTYATGKYISFVDSDDYVEPDFLEKMIGAIEQYDCDFVQCRYDYINHTESPMVSKTFRQTYYGNLEKTYQRKDFMDQHMALVAVWDKVYKREFLIENDIFCIEGLRCEDIFFSHLVFTYAKSVCCINDVLYHYCENPKGTMQQTHQVFQPDKMKVSVAYLSECLDRGLYEKRKEEVEWLFLKNYYIYMLWEVFHRFPEKSFEIYQETKTNIQDWIPDYRTNPYRVLPGYEFENLMLKLLDMDLDPESLEKIRLNMIQKIQVPV